MDRIIKITEAINSVLRLTVEIILIISLIVLYYLWKQSSKNIETYETSQLMLSKNYKKIIKIQNNKVKIYYRDREKIVEKVVYVPKEGDVTIIQPNNPNNDIILDIKNKGFTLKPGFGIVYNFDRLSYYIDLKVVYWNRYSLLIGGSSQNLILGASRHIDDILPFDNVEIFVGYGLLNNNKINVGFRNNF